MTRTLLMDLDGTLVDSVPDLTAALNRLLSARGLPRVSQTNVTAMVGDGVAALVARAFAAHGRTPDDDAVDAFSADYTAHAAVESRLYPDVYSTLTELAAAGWNLAVCTNKPVRAARAVLATLGLLPLLRAVGGGDSSAFRKPDPKHLLATLSEAAGTPERAVMIGDHRNDIVAASGAGIPSIFAVWGYGTAEMADGCTATAKNFTEAAAIATRLLA